MANKLFVGGLSWNTTEEGLRSAFAKFGNLAEARLITDRATGRSRGFGFVTFDNSDDGHRAIEEMDGQELDGRVIKVSEARDRPARPRQAMY